MNLTPKERFAITMLFSGGSKFDQSVRDTLNDAHVLDRKNTGVGFFCTIALPLSIAQQDRRARDWNFHHINLQHGGSLMCNFTEDGLLEIEGVVFDGMWPIPFRAEDFKPM